MRPEATNELTHEEIAIHAFCSRLSQIEGIKVDITARPDNRGRTGRSECDAIISRGGIEFTLEHTSLMTYGSDRGSKTKKEHEVLIRRYVTPLGIEDLIRTNYPNHWVSICLPIDLFDMKFRYEQAFNLIKDRLIDVVGLTPESRLGEETTEFRFEDIPFPISISRELSDTPSCFISYLARTNRDKTLEHLGKEVIRAVEAKRGKLKRAKEQGAQTILLMDSDDINLVNLRFLAKAFGEVALRVDFEGIDEVFVMYLPQIAPWIAPVKMGNKRYPNMPEFQKYVELQMSHRS